MSGDENSGGENINDLTVNEVLLADFAAAAMAGILARFPATAAATAATPIIVAATFDYAEAMLTEWHKRRRNWNPENREND